MEKKRALLVIAGGRAMPDILALYAARPAIVRVLISEQGWIGRDSFVKIAQSLPYHESLEIFSHDAYDLEKAKQACDDIYKLFQDADWVFSIGSGPKISSIAAYEIAKQYTVPCLFVDMPNRRVVSLVKDLGVTAPDLFAMDVDHYMRTQQRKRKIDLKKDTYQKEVEQWSSVARILALSTDTSDLLREFRDKPAGKWYSLPQTLAKSVLVQTLLDEHVLKIRQTGGVTEWSYPSKNHAKLLGSGDWLEVYVWEQVKEANFADNCQWGYEISSTANNEFDVIFTYQAQLLFAECKTEKEPFQGKKSHLDEINSKAEMVGKSYVTKVFVTSESKKHSGYNNFMEQAKLRQVVVATYEDLPSIGELLKEQAVKPTYPRI